MSNDEVIVIDARLCKICHKPLPKGRIEYCSDECYLEGKRQKDAERMRKLREKEKVDIDSIATKPGMITISVEDYTDLIRRVIREERQATEEEIYNKTVQVIDSRFNDFRSEVRKQLESIKQPIMLESPIEEPRVSEIDEECLLREINKEQFKRIQKWLDEERELTGKKNYEEFCDEFGIRKHYLLKAKDGDRAEQWAKDRVIRARQNTHHSIKRWFTSVPYGRDNP